VPSSPVIPHDDPTILFTNAGMNQFKDIFLGKRRVEYKRATTVQKCIRAGGKHNDLDNVGFTARHHTFFEMLGNFSFGDYFKEEAIAYAWEWITKTLKLPSDRLYVSVYETDEDAFRLWEKIAPELKNGRILRFGKRDNFWSMGDTGPCGPCSEIHFDRGPQFGTGPQDVVNGDGDRFIEFWNLVFMQYDEQAGGVQTPLPKPSVDTGAGLERIASLMAGVDSNYQIDLFQHLIRAIQETIGSEYKTNVSSHHVVADHLRALTFAIADGAGISNEGQGYVLRRILRRAARHGRLLGARDPFIHRLVPALIVEMGAAYPELREKQAHIERVIRAEEESFNRTLESGLELFDGVYHKAQKAGTKVIAGDDIFRLYDTYGFPYDLTEIMATEMGMTLDQAGFEKAMETQRAASKAARTTSESAKIDRGVAFSDFPPGIRTEFMRKSLDEEAIVLYARQLGDESAQSVAVVTDRTPFYFESGGQVSDCGFIQTSNLKIEVHDLLKREDAIVHVGRIIERHNGGASSLKGQTARLVVDADRRWDIMRNHTATHLLQAALRIILGSHVKQSGSYVGPDRLRFDFSHHQPMTPDEIEQVERMVNEAILKGTKVATDVMDIESAKKTGAMAIFGEKYGDTVRVVAVEGFSKELCGGTHVANVGQIGPFIITLETGIASGVRRIEALTGSMGITYMLEAKRLQHNAALLLGRERAEILSGIEQLRENNIEFQKEIKRLKNDMFSGGGKSVGQAETIGALSFVSHDFGMTDRDIMSGWVDSQKNNNKPTLVLALGTVDARVTCIAAVSNEALSTTGVDAGKFLGELLKQFGGRGGGKPNFAQGGIPEGIESGRVFSAAKTLLANLGARSNA
jgi:alanyl-tRNA synthetase